MDLGELTAVAAKTANERKELNFTLISKEYICTGLNWVNAMRRLGLSNFLIIAGDQLTSDRLGERGVHFVRANIDETALDPKYVSHDGFSAKGLAMIALKFPITSALLKLGYSVTFSDSDAIWLRDPMTYLRDADISFQRVAHHPPPISSLWSFAACTGFVHFRHSAKNVAFLDQCITEHRAFRCDQVAMNVALLEANADWVCEANDWRPPGDGIQYDRETRLAVFADLMRFPIKGTLEDDGPRLLALPHDKFWRHLWAARVMPDMVICHPNSPKDDLEKMKIFDEMGIRIAP